MAVKKTTDQIVAAFRLINPAKLTKMETSERFALILVTRQLKKVNDEFDALLKETQEKLKPSEGFDKIVEKLQAREELTPEEAIVWNKYNKEVTNCINTELAKETELEIEPLGKEAFEHLVASNDFSVSDIIAIQDVIGG